MEIFREDKKSKLSCGINDDGELFFGNDRSGSNLPDTPENREYVIRRFDEEIVHLYLSDWQREFPFDLKEILDYVKDAEEDIAFLHAFQRNPKLMDHYLSVCKHRMDKAEDIGGRLSWEEACYCFDDAILSTKAEFKENLQEYSLDGTQFVVQSCKILGDGEAAGSSDRFYADSLESAEEAYRIECGKGRLVDVLYGSPGYYDTVKKNYDFRDGHFVLNLSEPNFRDVFRNDGENTVILRQENVTSALDRAEGLSQYLVLGNWKMNKAMPEGEYATWIVVNNNVNGDFGRREGNYYPTFNCSGTEALDAAFSDFKARLEKEHDRMNRDQKKAKERGFTH